MLQRPGTLTLIHYKTETYLLFPCFIYEHFSWGFVKRLNKRFAYHRGLDPQTHTILMYIV